MKPLPKRPVSIVLVASFCILCSFSLAAEEGAKSALIIGSNSGTPTQKPLRYAHSDARQFAKTLIETAGYEPNEVRVLMDPSPSTVLAQLDHALSELEEKSNATLIFYYSGHAAHDALYPGGKALAISDLKARLNVDDGHVHIGIVDACQGGGWTGTKGMSLDAPLNIPQSDGGWREGTVLLASSSGSEDAHESDRLNGSYFTHHLTVGMRGAADTNRDGTVTVYEGFEYARLGTLRDSSRHSGELQHASFQTDFRGREAILLSSTSLGDTQLTLTQTDGPLQVFDLERGVLLVQFEPGEREVTLALSPGRYLVKVQRGKSIYAAEVRCLLGERSHLREAELTLIEKEHIALKHPEFQSDSASTSVPDHTIDLRFGLGRNHGTNSPGTFLSEALPSYTRPFFNANWGITDDLTWRIGTLGFAYRFGERGGIEIVPWAGLVHWGLGTSSIQRVILEGELGAGLSSRYWLSNSESIDFEVGSRLYMSNRMGPYVRSEANVAFTRHYNQVTINLGLGASLKTTPCGMESSQHCMPEKQLSLGFGSIHNRALRSVPLVQVHLTEHVSLEGHAAVHYSPETSEFGESYRIGVALTF